VVLEQLPSILQWASRRLQCNFGPAYTIANFKDGKISCVVVFHNQRQSGCEVSIVSDHGLSKGFIKVVFGYAFQLANLRRLSALVEIENQESIDLVERLGFIREGVLRHAADNGNNLYVYGMLKEECKWVRNQEVEAHRCHHLKNISL
jgi:RimJ/RimL family protein N-acetyltransferase